MTAATGLNSGTDCTERDEVDRWGDGIDWEAMASGAVASSPTAHKIAIVGDVGCKC